MMKPKSLLVCVVLLLTACSYKHGKSSSSDNATASEPSAELMATVSFAQVSQQIFQPKCVACHGTSGGVNLGTYASACQSIAKIKQAALVAHTMPKSPFPSLTSDELTLLTAWINAGWPEFPAQGTDPSPPEEIPLAPTFASIQANILSYKCVACHNPAGKAAKLPFQTLAEVADSDAVVAGNPALSDLYNVLLPTAKNRMPPAKAGMAPLSDEEIEIIKEWIANGAKD